MAKYSKEYIVELALKVIGEKGLEKATLREIAKEGGVSTGAIYHYFKNKEELLYEVMDSRLKVSSMVASDKNLKDKSKEEIIDQIMISIMERFDKTAENKIQFYLLKEAIKGDKYLKNGFESKYESWTNQIKKVLKYLYDVKDEKKLDAMAIFLLAAIDGLIMRHTLNDEIINFDMIGEIYEMIFRAELKEYFS